MKIVRATTRANVEQVVVDISKLEDQNLENQFKVACNNDARYQRVVKTIRDDHSQRIKNFSLVGCNLVDDFVYYRDRHKLVLDNDKFRFRLIRFAHDTSLIEYLEDVKYYKFYLAIIDKWACCKLFASSSTTVTFVSKSSTLETSTIKCLNFY